MRRPTDPRGPAREGRTGGIPVRAYRSGWAGVVSAGLPPTVRAPLVHGQARAEAEATGKPAQIVEKMAEGKVRKMIDELTLVGQPYCWDEKKRIGELLPKGTKIVAFARVRVGGGS